MASTKIRRLQLPLYFVLAYAITWSIQIPAYLYATGRGESLTNEANLLHFQGLFQGTLDPGFARVFLLAVFSFGPTLAGLIVIALVQGRTGIRELFSRLGKVRIPGRWIAVILGTPVALAVASVAVGFLLGGFHLSYSPLVPLALALPFLVYLLIFTGLAEEVGWRGYALPELQRRHTAEKASWILGIAWGLWHLPANLLMPYLAGLLTVPMAVAIVLGLTFGAVGWTIVLTWIYNNTGSLFWIIVLHGFYNWVMSYLVLSSGNYLAQVASGILPWAIAVGVLKRYGPETLKQRVPPAGIAGSSPRSAGT
ncbi:CPBP family intramembrane glutamic endopeptidase [Pseudarthrobacter sp. DSP2-3-2b1]|uniref:CPBP family intramembrane glutamic endopeptidase n=1 Tax=Pseudarthrobacter sp. DSP2-3-2b1 TaxID=2804661 RepID=UPI003CF4F273